MNDNVFPLVPEPINLEGWLAACEAGDLLRVVKTVSAVALYNERLNQFLVVADGND